MKQKNVCKFEIGFNSLGMLMIRCKTHHKDKDSLDNSNPRLKEKCVNLLVIRLDKILKLINGEGD